MCSLDNLSVEVLHDISCEGYNIMQTFQEKVKSLRQKKGWAQEDLAREVDVSLSTIQRWESKGAKPTRHARRQLQKLFQETGIDED